MGIGFVIGAGALAAMAFSFSCSDSESTGSSEPADPTKCGPGPYGQLTGTILEASFDGPSKPKADAVITIDLCPGKTFTTGADGKATVQLTKGKPVVFTVDHPDDLPAKTSEYQLDVDVFEGTAQLVPKLFRAILAPEFGEETTLIGLAIGFPDGAFDGGPLPEGGPTDPCLRREGVVYSVPGHPEAKITYFNTESIPKPDPSLTATSENGLAKVTDLADGTLIEPVATKAGCTVRAKHDGFTGRMTARKGFFVAHFMQMTK